MVFCSSIQRCLGERRQLFWHGKTSIEREAPGEVAVKLLQGAAEGPEVDGSDIGKGVLGHFKLDVLVPQYVCQVVRSHIRQPALKQPGDQETKRSCLADTWL